MNLPDHWQELLKDQDLSFMLVKKGNRKRNWHIQHPWAICEVGPRPHEGSQHGPYLPDVPESFLWDDLIYAPAHREEVLYHGKVVICKKCEQNFLNAVRRYLERQVQRRATGNYPK